MMEGHTTRSLPCNQGKRGEAGRFWAPFQKFGLTKTAVGDGAHGGGRVLLACAALQERTMLQVK